MKKFTNSGQFKKGVSTWNKGKKWSEETKEKMRQAKLKNPVRYWKGKQRLDLLGTNNHNYGKFGKEHTKWTENKKRPFYKSIRQLFKYVEWRKAIFEQDNYTCKECGISGVYIEADHYPKRFIDIIRDNNIESVDDALVCAELWNTQNGRTLCKSCHLKTDTWGRRKR